MLTLIKSCEELLTAPARLKQTMLTMNWPYSEQGLPRNFCRTDDQNPAKPSLKSELFVTPKEKLKRISLNQG